MNSHPLRTTVIGSYPFPGWLEFASQNLAQFGPADIAEAQDDAVICAIHDQMAAGLDVITDGEQTRLDFNLSFYGYIEGIELEPAPPRRFGPPAHDQRGKHKVIGELRAPRGLGAVEEFERLKRLMAWHIPPSITNDVEELLDELETATNSNDKKTIRQRLRDVGHTGGLRSRPVTGPALKASVPGPYTLSGRLAPNAQYKDRWALTEALLPI
ncbi:MAG TPA: hypothetical protein VFC78_23820, partial [Tepidisphaeraceae bacterium]|nr:hypothetical protein [Tepidisphaeraceae bacterium]